MDVIIDRNRCCGCSACMNICRHNAIEMIENEEGFKYPIINKEKCIGCGICQKVCPVINKKYIENIPKSYACYSKDEDIRMKSSSGGIFSVVASYILKQNGVIYGASFDENWMVNHIRVSSNDELDKLRTSKYIQSNINNAYKQAKDDLNNGKIVLFTGTPCQIDGFLNYLGDVKYDNLYTQDIICHGVPSPLVWKKYLSYRKKLDKNSPVRINFRQKDDGWNLYSLLLQYNNSEYKTNHDDDLFMKAFLLNACLRDSCYNCSSKSRNRRSDITLADFWGIDKVLPELNDDKGTSLVIVNTEKGSRLFEIIKDKVIWKETNFEESIKYNPSMYKSVDLPKYRNDFFSNIDNVEFNELVKKYVINPRKRNLPLRVLKKLKSVMTNKINKKL